MRTYADEGKSGLSIGGRQALQALIRDVENGAADFRVILVYDASRWGRCLPKSQLMASATTPVAKPIMPDFWPVR